MGKQRSTATVWSCDANSCTNRKATEDDQFPSGWETGTINVRVNNIVHSAEWVCCTRGHVTMVTRDVKARTEEKYRFDRPGVKPAAVSFPSAPLGSTATSA